MSDDAPNVEQTAANACVNLSILPTRQGDRYFCQSTELARATRPLSRWRLDHFLTDILNKELSLPRFVHIFGRMVVNRFRRLFGLRILGKLAGRQRASSKGDLNLRAGDWVDVRPAEEITATLDSNGKNAGLSFEPDMLEYCGGHYQVDFPIRKIILEETGQMIGLTHTVALKGVNCQGLCAKNCPRSNPLYWRETWLRRAE